MMHLRARREEIRPWAAAASVVLTANLLVGYVKDILDSLLPGKTGGAEIGLLAIPWAVRFLASVWWLYRMRKILFFPRTRQLKNEVPPPREHLILFLSNLDLQGDRYVDGVPKDVQLGGDLPADLVTLAEHKKNSRMFWRWEMLLRALQPHLGKLKSITVLCSPESITQVHWFGQLLTRIYSRTLPTVSVKTLLNYQPPRLADCPRRRTRVGGTSNSLMPAAPLGLLAEFKKQGLRDDKIRVDFTGGQKMTSVVAAAATFIASQCSVVPTPPFDILSFDILLTHSLTEGMGW